MIPVKNSLIARILKVQAIVLYPFIFFADKKPDEILINHEMIHVAQIRKLGVLRFYFHYMREYFLNRLKGQKHNEAYRSISFEKEAYEKQNENKESKTTFS